MNSWNERRIEESLAIHYDDAGKIKIKIVIEGDENSELLLESRNIICVIPFSKNFNSTEVVYVEPASDASAFPALKVAYVAAQGQLSKSILRDFAPSYLWDLVFDVKGRSVEDKNSYALEVIISTKSGAHYARDFWQKDVKRALEHLHVVEDFIRVHETVSTETITQLALDRFGPTANEGKPQIILLLSGDGGIADLVNGLLARQRTPQYLKPIVGLLPMGSGNALANSSGLLADETFGLSTAIRGEPKPVPVFKASFSEGARLLVDEGRQEEALQHGNTVHGVVVCSWGLHAALVADSDTAEYRRLGTERFKIAAKENLFPPEGEPHRYCGKVSVLRRDAYSGELVWQPLAEREEHAYVLVTMVSQFEKGFTISPETKPLDGRMMVVHFGPMAGEDIMNIMEGAYDGGRHVFDGAVGYEGIDGLRIEFDGREKDARYRRICVDGKIVAVDEYGWVEVTKSEEQPIDLICIQ